MSDISISLIQGIAYLSVLVFAIWKSWKGGEKEGSTYMLQYLRENKYKNELGIEVPFFDDTGYNKFMEHVRYEQKLKNEA